MSATTTSSKPLLDKVIVVTGGGRGIGRAIVEQVLSRGAKVATLDVSFPTQSSSSDEIQFTCDLSQETEVTETFATILSTYGRLDGLVNNAGVILEKPITETTVQDFERTIGVNLRATFLCAKTAVLQYKKQAPAQDGYAPRIVNIASEIGHSGMANYTVYTASKGAIYSFTRSLALELAPLGILVNNVAPGPTDTPMLQSEKGYPKWKQGEGIPLGRLASPHDIANAVCFLLSPHTAFITGSTIDVNGGAVMV